MIDSGDDKAGISHRLCSVMTCAEPPGATVGENNQRQLCPRDGTILHTHQAKIGGHRQGAERYMFRLPCAWIPDSTCQAWVRSEKLDAGGLRGKAQARQNDGVSPIRLAHQSGPQSRKALFEELRPNHVQILRTSIAETPMRSRVTPKTADSAPAIRERP